MPNLVEEAKKKAAYAAVDKYVADGMVIGIGSGSTVVYAVERIVQRVQEENLSLKCIPSSFQAKTLIQDNNLYLASLDDVPIIDVTIDGADEVDDQLNLIKGGGACHVQEKLLAYNSKALVIIADYRKISTQLGTKWTKGVPLEVLPMAVSPVLRQLKTLGADASIRMGVSKAGPVVSDNGNIVVDAKFGAIYDPIGLQKKLERIPGIFETGLFIRMATEAFFG